MSLLAYVRLHQSDSDAAILSAVNAKDQQRTNNEFVTSRTLAIRLGLADATAALGALQAASATNPLLDSMRLCLASTGIDFSHELTQQMISQLEAAGAFSAELAIKLRELGVWYVSKASVWLGRDATVEDVGECRTQIARERLEQAATERINRVWAGISDGSITDDAGIVATFGA